MGSSATKLYHSDNNRDNRVQPLVAAQDAGDGSLFDGNTAETEQGGSSQACTSPRARPEVNKRRYNRDTGKFRQLLYEDVTEEIPAENSAIPRLVVTDNPAQPGERQDIINCFGAKELLDEFDAEQSEKATSCVVSGKARDPIPSTSNSVKSSSDSLTPGQGRPTVSAESVNRRQGDFILKELRSEGMLLALKGARTKSWDQRGRQILAELRDTGFLDSAETHQLLAEERISANRFKSIQDHIGKEQTADTRDKHTWRGGKLESCTAEEQPLTPNELHKPGGDLSTKETTSVLETPKINKIVGILDNLELE